MDLTEAEDIKKRWQEYTEQVYKKENREISLYSYLIDYINYRWIVLAIWSEQIK